MLEACRSKFSIAELREALHLDFERLNRSLVAVGEKPDIYPDLQASLVANYVHENELAIIDELRNVYFEQLDRHEPAWDYWSAREAVRTLAPNAVWLLRYKEVPPEQIADHVVAWLRAQGAETPGTNLHGLKPVDEVRQFNGGAILKFVKAANALVKAWCAKENRAVPAVWQDSDGGVATLRGAFDKAGVLDFRPLDNAALLIWSSVIGAWPAEMPQSLERADLGVVEADFDAERAKALAETEARKREARSIPFNGRKVDPEEVDWQIVRILSMIRYALHSCRFSCFSPPSSRRRGMSSRALPTDRWKRREELLPIARQYTRMTPESHYLELRGPGESISSPP